MKIAKFTIILIAALALSMPAWAGNIPEFDAVGNDSSNVFAVYNQIQYGQVIARNIGYYGPINFSSDFTDKCMGPYCLDEDFFTSAGALFPDPCFGDFGNEGPYLSAMTDAWNEATYEWIIALQMKPESDLNLNIYDCVLKHNTFTLWGTISAADAAAEQTGRYRAPWGQLFFTPNQNPIISVKAWPGDFPTPGFDAPFTMDARTLPGLDIVPLEDAFYTSKALWSEGIIMVMPETGVANFKGETMYNLKQGDLLQVQIYVNPNPTDLFYGQDNVIVKYIGITGTWLYDYQVD
jgi:hypothetical protein